MAARLDKTEGRVGDVFVLSVTSIGPRNVSTNLPTQLDLAPFEVVGGDPELEATDLGDGRVRRTFSLKVAAYEPGELTLPPIPVTYIGTGGHVLSRTHRAGAGQDHQPAGQRARAEAEGARRRRWRSTRRTSPWPTWRGPSWPPPWAR